MDRLIISKKLIIIAALIFIACICVGFVALNAESSKLQYEINQLEAEAQASSFAIANLEVKIESATNVNNLESRALEMGLIYPSFDNIVTIKKDAETSIDLAMALKSNAFN